jgi:uncharacterized protein (TIGR02611 family)
MPPSGELASTTFPSVETAGREPDGKPTLVERLRAQQEHHHHRPKAVRVVVALTGFVLLAAGAALLVLPGPAFAVLPVALAILSLEFLWAERLMEKAVEQAEKAKAEAMKRSKTERRLLTAATLLATAAGITAILLWDIPYLPF